MPCTTHSSSPIMKVSFTGAILAVVASIMLSAVTVQATNYTDVDILNFALNLECLEAEFYSWIAYGEGIYTVDSSLVGTGSNLTASSSGVVAGGSLDSAAAHDLAIEIAENEIAHVAYLREALGSAAVACPKLSLSVDTFTAAATAAVAALGDTLTAGETFDPYNSDGAFYLAAFIFEDVGVTAYKGAIQNLQSSTYAAAAAGIMAIEAGHAAVIRQQLYLLQTASTTTGLTYGTAPGTAIDFSTAVKGITTLRDNLGGTSSSSVENILTRSSTVQGTMTTAMTNQPDLFAANSNAVAYSRTPTQVLDIVYFSNTTTPGGFLPQGATGNADVLQITANSTKTCTSGAVNMASLSIVSAAAMAVAAVFAL